MDALGQQGGGSWLDGLFTLTPCANFSSIAPWYSLVANSARVTCA
jgi:hypothetical protein